MTTRVLVQTLYSLFGILFLVAGLSVLLLGTDLLPAAARDLILDIGQGDGNTLHIIQEFGSLLVFTGLISLWFVRHYDRSWAFHWALTLFWGLFALVHWFDVSGSFHVSIGAAVNTVPVTLFLVVGLLRRRSERS